MNEDWLHKIHDRMTDYEIDEPESLWNAIESRQAELSSAPRRIKRPVMIWVRRCVAVAAMIAVVITAGVFFFNVDQTGPATQLLPLTADIPAAVSVNKPLAQAPVDVAPRRSAETKIRPSAPAEQSVDTTREPAAAEADTAKTEETHETTETPERVDRVSVPPAAPHDYIASLRPGKASAGGKLSVSVYSGGTSSGFRNSADYDLFSGPQASADPVWKDNLMMGIPEFSVAEQHESDIRHHLPVRACLSFTYHFTPRIGLESGLSYTILTSDVREGRKNQYYTGRQKLQYIGIPLNLKYTFLTWKRIELYTSTGILAEKCVSAKLDKQFITNHQSNGFESENLSEKPMQWSVNGAVGLQCNIINSMSIFAEPGISHYFDDGTSLQTIYKEKILNFNLNMGVRFTW